MTPKSKECRKFVFSTRSITGLPACPADSKSREVEYRDAACPGLTLRVSKNGRRFFQHRYNFIGSKHCLAIGEFPHVSVDLARQITGSQRSLVAIGKNPSAEKAKEMAIAKAEETFEQFSFQYIDYARQRIKTWQNEKWKIEKILIPAFGKTRLSAITTRDVAMLHVKENERTSACSANHVLSTIRTMLHLAIRHGLLEKNPCDGIRKFRENIRERYLTKEELPRFMRALVEENDTLSKAAILLLLYTGCRRNEILSMKYSQIRLDEGRIYLPITKNGRSRSVILNQKASEILQDLAVRKDETDRTKNSDYVFPSRQGAKNRKYLYDLRKTLNGVCALAGISGFRCHDLRHTYASWALASGAHLATLQKLLGHSDINMTMRYSHTSSQDMVTATENFAALIEQQIAA